MSSCELAPLALKNVQDCCRFTWPYLRTKVPEVPRRETAGRPAVGGMAKPMKVGPASRIINTTGF